MFFIFQQLCLWCCVGFVYTFDSYTNNYRKTLFRLCLLGAHSKKSRHNGWCKSACLLSAWQIDSRTCALSADECAGSLSGCVCKSSYCCDETRYSPSSSWEGTYVVRQSAVSRFKLSPIGYHGIQFGYSTWFGNNSELWCHRKQRKQLGNSHFKSLKTKSRYIKLTCEKVWFCML